MLNKELLILDRIYLKPEASQRELALSTGISLGQTNITIKKLTFDGFLRQDAVGKRKIKYSLTQRGLAERARLSNEAVLLTIQNYRKIKRAVIALLNKLCSDGYKEFILEGDRRGEMHEVIADVFDDNFREKATLYWGPQEPKEGQLVLNLDRRFLTEKHYINVLHEITI
ncbi:MAG: winged helix-turn-helix transcriptional regulator [Deltaproteobacteria bacterium]|nr:winged helix-turn-helix transcriptional regulator [Deltaproteobacteria bacterium]MBI2342088.1 winged helix-turn-helix transcriptional regulator [Deltaproteobacteria bacterium]